MRKLITTLAMAGVLGLGTASATSAAPVLGFEGLYSAVAVACSVPTGTLAACEAAINAYAAALVANVDISVANKSFQELRGEVFTANAPDQPFQADVDALFELLLPESGAIAPAASPTVPG